MIHIEGKTIIDIVFDNIEALTRMSRGVLDSKTIYVNPIENIKINGNSPYISSTNTETPAYCEINIGDMVEYNIVIMGKSYKITNVSCDSEDIIINDNAVFFTNIGEYRISLKFKTYNMLIDVKVCPIFINLS